MNIFPIAKAFRQIPPGDPCPIAIEHRLNEQAVVSGGYPDCLFPSGQDIFDPIPLVIAQPEALHGQPPTKLTAHESKNESRRNPLPRTLAKSSVGVAIGTHRDDLQMRIVRSGPSQRP